MMRLIGIILFLFVAISGAAPVPKQAANPPEKLTSSLMIGKWAYEYGGAKSGLIEFWMEPDGTELFYRAQHDPTSRTHYYGSVDTNGDEITIHEFGYEDGSDRHWGPTLYRFKVDLKSWPVLKGGSSHAFHEGNPETFPTHLKLHSRTVVSK